MGHLTMDEADSLERELPETKSRRPSRRHERREYVKERNRAFLASKKISA